MESKHLLAHWPRAARGWLVVAAVALLLGLSLTPGLRAQQDESPPQDQPEAQAQQPDDQSEAQGEQQGTQDEGENGTSDIGDIDQILAGEEQALQGGGYTYDPGDRRDPFKSLLAARDRPELRGPRPEGIPGLLIDEVQVTGIFHTGQGWIAQVQSGKKEKSYLLKEGDQLYDGDVVSISQNEVVFKQIVQDPAALKPFREVVKKLNP
jgi:hypothetical protein